MAVTASIVIDYGGIENAIMSVELDSVLNGGQTTFNPGDPVFLKLYTNVNYEILLSSGTYSIPNTNVPETLKEVISFILSPIASVSKKIDSIISTLWYDNDLGTLNPLSGSAANSVQASNPGTDPVAVCKLTYGTHYDSIRIAAGSGLGDSYSILVVIRAIE
jgi:hypothetical protein